MNTVVESVVSSSEVAQTKPKKELHPTWRSLLIFALVLSVVWLFISLGLFILCATVVRGAALLLILLPITITVIHFLNIFLISKNLKSNEVKYLSGLPVL